MNKLIYLICFFFLILFNSCICRKDKCLCDQPLAFTFSISSETTPYFDLIVTKKNNYSEIIDTIPLADLTCYKCPTLKFKISNAVLNKKRAGYIEMNDHSYILKHQFLNIADTITSIKYKYSNVTVSCDACTRRIIRCQIPVLQSISVNGKWHKGMDPELVLGKPE